MTFYESNDEVRPTGVEPDEFVDAPPRPGDEAGRPAARDDPGSAEPGSPLDTRNLPGDNRPPASAHPMRPKSRQAGADRGRHQEGTHPGDD